MEGVEVKYLHKGQSSKGRSDSHTLDGRVVFLRLGPPGPPIFERGRNGCGELRYHIIFLVVPASKLSVEPHSETYPHFGKTLLGKSKEVLPYGETKKCRQLVKLDYRKAPTSANVITRTQLAQIFGPELPLGTMGNNKRPRRLFITKPLSNVY